MNAIEAIAYITAIIIAHLNTYLSKKERFGPISRRFVGLCRRPVIFGHLF